ncbi:hypothetical protein ABFX02_09G099500 [Erythranthe guttata]
MEMSKHNSYAENPRKRKQKHERTDDAIRVKRRRKTAARNVFDKLPDDILIAILSHMSLKDAVRASVLSQRWRNLWKFTSRALVFSDRDTPTGARMDIRKFQVLLARELELNQSTGLDSLIIRFSNRCKYTTSDTIDDWIFFAMQKDLKNLELDFSVRPRFRYRYKFPDACEMVFEHATETWLCGFSTRARTLKELGVFASLRTVKLVDLSIKDEVVHHFLSCACIEQLCIRGSRSTKNLRVVDPLPNLKQLEISNCRKIRSLVISAKNLVSCTYQGRRKISFPFKENPNLTELTLDGPLCESFIYEPKNHSSYSFQLTDLVLKLQISSFERTIAPTDLPRLYALTSLELNIVSEVDRSLLFFLSLIKSSPHLHHLKIKIDYLVSFPPIFKRMIRNMMAFPEVNSIEENEFKLEKLKVVEIVGYCGSASEEKLLLNLLKIAPSIETVFIYTDCDYYARDYPEEDDLVFFTYRLRQDGLHRMKKNDRNKNRPLSRFDAIKHANKLRSSFTSETRFVIT